MLHLADNRFSFVVGGYTATNFAIKGVVIVVSIINWPCEQEEKMF